MQDIYKKEGSDAAPCSTILKAIETESLKRNQTLLKQSPSFCKAKVLTTHKSSTVKQRLVPIVRFNVFLSNY